MKTWLAILTYLSALLGLAPFLRPRRRSAQVFLWPYKLLGGALAPVLGLFATLGAGLGLARRDWKLILAGVLGAGFSARFLAEIPASRPGFAAAFGPDWADRLPPALRPHMLPHRWSLFAPAPRGAVCHRNLIFGLSPHTHRPLCADLWLPPPGVPSTGLGAIYAHGSGWRVGDKDLGTRAFFRRLAAQGHVVLDVAYTLWPRADLPAMVAELNQAVLWLQGNGPVYGVNPQRVVLMGGSAGAHLALLAAFAPHHPAFCAGAQPAMAPVRGVVAFYPPVDLFAIAAGGAAVQEWLSSSSLFDHLAEAVMRRIFMFRHSGEKRAVSRLVPEMLGGDPSEIPDRYRLLSPIYHVGPHCPPTLLLQGTDDLFDLAPGVRSLYRDLRGAGVPAILVEFPHVEHGFDLVLPCLSPVAQVAIYDVERFLALLT